MINQEMRFGRFTSSEIVALTTLDKKGTGFGKPALTYIQETNMERRLGRSVSEESNARPLLWGKYLESRIFDLLGLEYTLTSKETIIHSQISCWAGSPDGGKYHPVKTVLDIKAPFTLKSFCQLVDSYAAGGIEEVRNTHKDGEKYYWQLISNSILTGVDHAELIVYLPYQSELDEIRSGVSMLPGEEIGKYYWLGHAMDDELPYLVDGGYYQNLNILSFEVPQADKDFLAERVLMAAKELIEFPETVKALIA